eukprot:TRINITY_DN31889_c0_g1_i1.p1 TRINITY_DN31889_c0_g1~~TRINITY_DN31889_c0_g1_i1.p1  ORF type:complete len:386 (-),score=29.84 TRINITY_DN31889_c0_g1_i1:267-1424(-)
MAVNRYSLHPRSLCVHSLATILLAHLIPVATSFQEIGVTEDSEVTDALRSENLMRLEMDHRVDDMVRCLRRGREFHLGFDIERVDQAQALCLRPADVKSASTLIYWPFYANISCSFIRNSTQTCEWFTQPKREYWRSLNRDFPPFFGIHYFTGGLEFFWSCCSAVRQNPYKFFQRLFTAEVRISFPKGDIGGHLMFLRTLAARESTSRIVELGTRKGSSTMAFLLGLADQAQLSGSEPTFKASTLELISYDVEVFRYANIFREVAEMLGVSYSHRIQSSLEAQIPSTDILFIDTLHSYGQLRRELALHHHSVKNYIVLHDTETWADEVYHEEEAQLRLLYPSWPEEDFNQGLRRGVDEFLQAHSEWKVIFHFENDNGLTVLARSR